MSDLDELLRKSVVYTLSGMEAVDVTCDLVYRTVGDIELSCDV